MQGALVRKIEQWGRTDFITFCYERQMLTMAEAIGLIEMQHPSKMGEFVVSQTMREIRDYFQQDDDQEPMFSDALATLK